MVSTKDQRKLITEVQQAQSVLQTELHLLEFGSFEALMESVLPCWPLCEVVLTAVC